MSNLAFVEQVSFPICRNGRRRIRIFGTFPGICCMSESAEKLAETFRQCTFSLDNVLQLGFWSGCLLMRPRRCWKWPSGCAHLLVHASRPPRQHNTPRSKSTTCLQGSRIIVARTRTNLLRAFLRRSLLSMSLGDTRSLQNYEISSQAIVLVIAVFFKGISKSVQSYTSNQYLLATGRALCDWESAHQQLAWRTHT